jgi:protein-disulfide isomerase
MGRKEREQNRIGGTSASSGAPLIPLLTLVGVGAVLLLNVYQWNDGRKARTDDSTRMARLENNITQLSAKVDAIRKAATPPNQGPDPNKVYTVQTAGAPAKGPATAPITIAEFSDFQ